MISSGQNASPSGPSHGPQSSLGLAPNIASLLSYICPPFTGIVFLLLEKIDKDVRFHSWQSIVLGASFWFLAFILKLMAVIMGFLAGVLEVMIDFFVWPLILATIAVWVICLIKAYQGERWRIPVVGDVAAKMAGETA